MLENPPLISVIIPAYNREAYIAEAIESVLQQDYPRLELIVVDDGSTDGTAREIRRFEPYVRYVYQENGGTAAARNKGAAQISGDFVSFCDSDDLWKPGKLAAQLAVFEGDPGVDVVYHSLEQFISPELDQADRQKILVRDRILKVPGVISMLIRFATYERVGPFDESLRVASEMEWYARLADIKPNTVMLEEVYYRRRIHTNNSMAPRDGRFENHLQVLKRTLDRRRQSGA